MKLNKIENLVEIGLTLSGTEISGEAFKVLTEFLEKELQEPLHICDVMLRFKLRLNIDEWGCYKKGDEFTFHIKLLDKKTSIAKFAIDKQWDIVSCEVVNEA